MLPVIHKRCGTQIGWYLLDDATKPRPLSSNGYQRMNGDHPQFGEKFSEKCPVCGLIYSQHECMIVDH